MAATVSQHRCPPPFTTGELLSYPSTKSSGIKAGARTPPTWGGNGAGLLLHTPTPTSVRAAHVTFRSCGEIGVESVGVSLKMKLGGGGQWSAFTGRFLAGAQGSRGHWEEWECRDKDDQWGRNAGVLLS